MKKLLVLFIAGLFFFTSFSYPADANSIAACSNSPSCAATLVQQGILQPGTGVGVLSSPAATATGVTAVGVITAAGLGAWKNQAEQNAIAAGDVGTEQCVNTVLTWTGVTGTQLTQAFGGTGWHGVPFTPFTVSNGNPAFEFFHSENGSRQDRLGTNPSWTCTEVGNVGTDVSPDTLADYMADLLDSFDFSPYTNTTTWDDASDNGTPVIDPATGDLVDAGDFAGGGDSTDDQVGDDTTDDATDDTSDDSSEDANADGVPDVLQEPLVPATFSSVHFLVHAQSVFSEKFPLDLLGTLPSGGSATCPSLTLFGYTYELCIVVDLLSVFKWPAILAVAIWALLTL